MRRPPILFTRPTYDWIRHVAQKHHDFTALQPSQAEIEKIDRSIDAEFVSCAFHLEGVEVSQTQMMNLASSSGELAGLSEVDRSIAEQLEALRIARATVEREGKNLTLTPELLLELRSPSGNAQFRKSAGDMSRSLKPAPPEHLNTRLQSACFWFSVESFLELNAVEQAAIVLLRLIEIQPFEDHSDRTSITAASLFLMRSQLPPIVIRPGSMDTYRASIEESFQSNTKPMVELVAQVTEETLTTMIESINKNR
jgi:hypothetical protein